MIDLHDDGQRSGNLATATERALTCVNPGVKSHSRARHGAADGPRLQRAQGAGRLAANSIDGRSRLAVLYEEGAARIRLPRTHDASLEAVLMNTAGGLTGGDRLDWRAEAGPGSHLVLTTPACERIYRSLGPDAEVETHLVAAAGARLDWLPQETILFAGSRLRRRLEVDLDADATLLAVEAVLLGRADWGERAIDARLRDDWRIRRGGRLLHAEATRLSGDPLEREALSLLAGARAFATILYIGADAPRRLEAVRALPAAPAFGASLIGDRLVVRALAPGGLALRRAIVPAIAALSAGTALPRLWSM
jgi:urease accessory protein